MSIKPILPDDLDEAGKQLAAELHAIFAPLERRLIPAETVESLSVEVAEDNALLIEATLAGGRCFFIKLKRGEPIGVSSHCVGLCDGTVPCDVCGAGSEK